MGALRAAEMKNLGVLGFGFVYRYFSLFEGARDDEVALFFFPISPFEPCTEPLINTKYVLKRIVKLGRLTRHDYRTITDKLSNIWYGRRTNELVKELILELSNNEEICEEYQRLINELRIKNLDLQSFLMSKPWIHC